MPIPFGGRNWSKVTAGCDSRMRETQSWPSQSRDRSDMSSRNTVRSCADDPSVVDGRDKIHKEKVDPN